MQSVDLRDVPTDILASALRARGCTVTPPNQQSEPGDEPALKFARRHGFDARVGNAIHLTRSRRDLPHIETASDLADAVEAGRLTELRNVGPQTVGHIAGALEEDGIL